MNALNANGVFHKYDRQQVLSGFSLGLDKGDFLALMGPSGSGKSTFLHLAAGLLECQRGRIEIGGVEISAMNDSQAAKFRRRHVGVVFQAFNLLPEKTVEENIALPVRLDGVKVDSAALRALAAKISLEGLLAKKAMELSGGEQQRVAIARALFAKPDIVLADEPTGNLDAAASRSICRLLGEINESEKIAVLLVTHDPQVAATAKKVAFIRDGAIAAVCATEGDAERVSRLYLETYR